MAREQNINLTDQWLARSPEDRQKALDLLTGRSMSLRARKYRLLDIARARQDS